ncbi:MAG TPA: AEC family transporter [Caulobacterales bacterium]|nr:AEC family transporter [Caulobacterales bacterium]
MTDVIAELAPVFILIALGFVARETRIASAEAFGHVNRFGFFVLYPAFLFTLSSSADVSGGDAGPFVLGVLAGFVVMIALAFLLKPFFKDGPAFTSVFQGSVRWNGFVLLTAAPKLYGPLGPQLIGLAFGPLVLFVNAVCVAVLARWGEKRAASWRALLDQIIANPLILSCLAGLAARAVGVHELGPVTDALKLLGQAAMPVALVCVGAGLDFKALRATPLPVATACVMKLAIAPLVMFFAAKLCGAGPVAAAIAAGVGSTPTAAAGYTMAREMGGDAKLMAAIVTATTLASCVTMPIAIALAGR